MGVKNFLLDLFFSKFCFGCQKEGEYLCSDCQGLLEILENNFCLCPKPIRLPRAGKCQRCSPKHKLNGLYFALSYQNKLVQKLIHQFKYEPFLRELAKPLAWLIISHWKLLDPAPFPGVNFSALIPVPLDEKRLKWRGFNQAEELAKELSHFLNLPLLNNVLIKTKATQPQTELTDERERRENVRGVFELKNKEKIKGEKILLVDDVSTTGSTLEEAAKVLKKTGAKEVWGVVIARG